ncbi:MAG: thiol protease/hemagglutinin PrtT [Bacteroidetes bacterium]|nr:thiol protease/hemagglutinin PrtT [Bacteroidota bacterium]
MKKRNIYFIVAFVLITITTKAAVVPISDAKNLASMFYNQHSNKPINNLNLFHTELSKTGQAIYYVFNVNTNDGFVIVSAEDATRPILGYSTQKKYVIPVNGSTIGNWMKRRANEIETIRSANITATNAIKNEWSGNFGKTSNLKNKNNNNSTMSVAPLISTTWNQLPFYNDSCPGVGSNQAVTGCVATAMAQIMKFWNYPAAGTSSASYCDCTGSGFSTQYGTLSANFGITSYNWSAMPLNVSGPNPPVAQLMYQCGVSVNMDYGPNGSGAWVISADNPICAQNSYTTYFSYDPTTIQGLSKSNYTDSAWVALLRNELNIGRPIQYVGNDPSQGGHTWVCDGFDSNDNFHMNWGWGGQDDGYFPLSNLTTSSGYNPVQGQEALIGIKPMATTNDDSGISAIVNPSGTSCSFSISPTVILKNFGADTLKKCLITYNIDNTANSTYTWTGVLITGSTINVILPSMAVSGAGTHTFTSATSMPNGVTDANPLNDKSSVLFNINGAPLALPLIEGFESSMSLPNGWTLYNPNNDCAWTVNSTVAHTGTNCIAFNNFNGDNTTDMTGRVDWFVTKNYDFTSIGSASLSFAVAYAPMTYSSTLYADTLEVKYSTDCGATWHQIYKKTGTVLATAPTATNTSVGWAPASSSQWRVDAVNVSALSGQSNVLFAFVNVSDWGEWLYIDDINISANAVTGIKTTGIDLQNVLLYPNPSNDNITIALNQSEISSISVVDVLGKSILSQNFIDGEQSANFDVSRFSNGIYFVKVISKNNQSKTIRFVKN